MDNINPSLMLRMGAMLNGRYRIQRYLSSGGFGNTYVAINEFGEEVAIKEFFLKGINHRDDNNTTVSVSNNENRDQFTQQLAKFKKEALRLRGLHSQHIVKVQSFFEENNTAYYVMDYIDGESLSDSLKRTGQPMPEPEVMRIFDQVLEALEESHAKGIYHLDLKPGNIMLDKQGLARLIDFGASKQSDGQGGVTVTAPAFTKGYAPLEQVEGRMDKIGPWTDFYALGATLYRLLTNQTPPQYSDIQDEGKTAFTFPKGLSTETRNLITWLMTPNRTQRPQTVATIRQRMGIPHIPQPTPPPVESPQVTPIDSDVTLIKTSNPTSPPKIEGELGDMTPINRDKLRAWAADSKRQGKIYQIKRFGDKLFSANDMLLLDLYEQDQIRNSSREPWQNLGILVNNDTRVHKAAPVINNTSDTPPSPLQGGTEKSGPSGGIDYGSSTGGYTGYNNSADEDEKANHTPWILGFFAVIALIIFFSILSNYCTGPAYQVANAIDTLDWEADSAVWIEVDSAVAAVADSVYAEVAEIREINYQDGAKYIGEVSSNGEPSGTGTLEFADGTKYEGTFENGHVHGKGIMVWTDGERYEGEFRFGERTGYGILTCPENRRDYLYRYEGYFVDGKFNGNGTAYYVGGTVEKGTWKNGKFISNKFS